MNGKKISFLGKKVYIGIDVHKKTYALTAISEGIEVKRCSMPSDGLGLVEYIHKHFKGAQVYSVYEAGFGGLELHRTLKAHGIENIVVNASSIEVAPGSRKKTDRRDSQRMAEQLSAGRLRCIYIPSEQEEVARQMNRTRDQIVKLRVKVGNQIKSKLFYFGYLKSNDDRRMSESFLKEVEGSAEILDGVKRCLSYLIEAWRLYSRQLEEFKREFLEQSFEDGQREEIYRSVPGIGSISARTLSNELGDLAKRFSSQKKLFQYTGLTPSEYSSGERVHRGHIDRQGAARIRATLVEVAWPAVKKDKALAEAYQRIASTRGAKRAIVAIARKIIGRIRACFIHQQTYQLGLN